MRAEEIEKDIHALVCAMVRASGVCVECMEPLVFMAKLRRTPEGRGRERISWMGTPLFEVRRQRVPEGVRWTLHSPDGTPLREMLQERTA